MGRGEPTQPTVLRAAWVAPGDTEPISQADVHIRDGRIVSVDKAGGPLEPGQIDLGGALLLPGLINSHTHLELSGLRGKAPYTGHFVTWLGQVTARRPKEPADVADAVLAGADASLAAGVTCVGDICYGNLAWPTLKAHAIRAVCFAECLGIGRKQPNAIQRLAEQMAGMSPDDGLKIGISPHAPYSAARQVYRACLKLSAANGWVLTTHLAETQQEVQFVRDGTGNLYRMLQVMGIADQSVKATGLRPVAYARQIGLLDHPALLAHVNYLDDQELEMLASSPCSVVYCPRSHRYFRHKRHRFREMLEAGINVCIGTDSLASNESLSVLDELRFLRRRHRDLSSNVLLAMGTINGARALRLAERIGSIAPGKQADLIAIDISQPGPPDPVENVLQSKLPPKMVMVAGRVVRSSGNR